MRICLAGITGVVGSALATAIVQAEDLTLVAGLARRAQGQHVHSIRVSGSLEDALRVPSDVFVDYTSATAVKANVLAALASGRHVVIGSSGLTDDEFIEVDRAARTAGLGVISAGNFASSATLLQKFALHAARFFRSWEIIDYADAGKIDAPSGMARELAWRLSEVGGPEQTVPIERTRGLRAARGADLNHTRVHSLRLPGYTIGLEVRFGGRSERLNLQYEGGADPGPYIAGTLLAIRRVSGVRGLIRGLDRISISGLVAS